ncbi:MAG: hypothetical protein ABL921_03185 [Pirellula sp.]
MSTQPTGESQTSPKTRESPVHPSPPLLDIALGSLGGIAGACLGYVLFQAIVSQGFYALVLPGVLTGIGCGSLSGRRSITLGIASAVIGMLAGIFTEWRFAPFTEDSSIAFFISHLHRLTSFTQFLIVIGGILAFWFGMGRTGGAWPRKQAVAPEN